MLTKQRIIILAITGVMAALITGGVVMAQEEDGASSEDATRQTLASRVATILGLEADVVQDAFKQARGDIRDERLQMKLDRLVGQGRLDQEQADELRDWYESRPEFSAGAFFGKGKGGRGHGFHGSSSFGRQGFSQWGRFGQNQAVPSALAPNTGGTSY
ncbi:MAG: hypothetical protein BZY88_08285 [SAR202 cluster bacterium Io17-Chloro-G9]|nr:MAG: hypothetical protein BZY88_08285 [SAR202 cluster bacterium Io17-Chloro-G9]